MIKVIKSAANYVYKQLGSGHQETVYREAMSLELQERGLTVKTEAPINILFKTKKGKHLIVGGGRVDLYVANKKNEYAVLELKAMKKIVKEDSSNFKKTKEYLQLQKYLKSLRAKTGYIINFPFPPEKKVEIIE